MSSLNARVPLHRVLSLGGFGAHLWQIVKPGVRGGFVPGMPAATRRPLCTGSSVVGPAYPESSHSPPPTPAPAVSLATPTRLLAPRGRPPLCSRSRPAALGARGPLNCSQNGWRLDQLICKAGVNHLIRGPHAGRQPGHLLCSEVAAPAACLSGEMEIRRRTKPPRGQAAPSAARGWVAGAGPT